MSELLELAQRVAGEAGPDEAIEAFATHDRTIQIKAFAGEVESISSAEPRGIGLRVVTGGRVGFSYTTDLSSEGLSEVLTRARDNSRHATADEAVALAPAWDAAPGDIDGLFDGSLLETTADQKVEFTLALEKATRTFDPRVRAVEDALYADSISEIAIATSTGVAGAYRETDAWCYAVAIAEDGDDTEVGFDFGLARSLAGLDVEDVARRSAERAVGILGAKKIPSARMPVVFDPYTAGQFLGVLAGALTAEAVQKKRSLFADKLSEEIAGSTITLIDDGRVPGAPGSAPWDAEGVPTSRTEVIAAGKLVSFLYDLTSARREGRASTGNASRAGYKGVPHPAATNLAFEPTGGSREQVLRSAGRALLVQDFHGVHSGANPVSGDFSVGATGRLIDEGTLGPPVKEVTIAAPIPEILRAITAVADDRRWLPFGGSLGGATTLVAEMTVAGL